MNYTFENWGITAADCCASDWETSKHMKGISYPVSATAIIPKVIPRHMWYLGDQQRAPLK